MHEFDLEQRVAQYAAKAISVCEADKDWYFRFVNNEDL